MRWLWALLIALIFPVAAAAQTPVFGSCEQGGNVVVTQGLNSTNKVQQSFPSCTVSIFDAGTTNLSSIFSDSSSTPKANPFTASAAGLWFFYANNGSFDVQLSSGGIASPFIIRTVKIADATASGISGSGTSNRITKWTSTSGVGNSQITDNGTSVGINNTSPSVGALLDLTSTTLGLLPPRMTTTQRNAIGTPSNGLLIYNTSTDQFNGYQGGAWGAIGGGGSGTVTSFSAGTLSPLFTTSVATATTTPALSFTLSNQAANLIFAAPSSGGAAAPTFRNLVKADQVAATVYTDQSNTFTTGTQDFSSATFLKVVVGGGLAPTASGLIGYDSTGNTLVYGANGTSRVVVNTSESQSLSNKTLVVPVIGDFTSATHSHQNAAGGGTLDTAALASGILSIARGGTNSTSANYNTNGAFYWDGTKFITTATGGAGTLCLVSVAGGVPAFGSCAGSAATAMSSFTASVGANSLNSGDNAQIWQWTLTTASKTGLRLSENTASAAGGTPLLIAIDTLSTSTVNPFQVTAGGTANGVRVNTSGTLAKIGTGSVQADALASLGTTVGFVSQSSAGAFTARTLTASTGITLTNGTGAGGNPTFSVDQTFAPTWTGVHTFAPTLRTSGSAAYLVVTSPADTTLAASTEAIGISFNTSAQRQFATGALTTNRETLYQAPTYKFVGVSTLTEAATVAIDGAPIAGTNATITNGYGLWVGNTTDHIAIPNQVSPFSGGIVSGKSYADSGSGNIFQVAGWAINSGTRAAVGVFGTGRADGANSSAWGGNFVGYVNNAGAGATAKGIEVDTGRLVAGTGTAISILSTTFGGNGATAHLWMQSGSAGSEATNGIVFAATGGVNPVTGALITTNGSPSVTTGIDFATGTPVFSTAPILFANNSFFKAKDSGGTNRILLGIDTNNGTVLQSAGGGAPGSGIGFRIPNAANSVNLFTLADATGNATIQGSVQLIGVAFASLGTPSNGTFQYCSDCTNASNPCTGSGNGALAKRLNGGWDCR